MTFAILAALVCGAASAPAVSAADSSLEALWRRGEVWADFERRIEARAAVWRANIARAAVPDDLRARAGTVRGFRLLIVTVDRCSDSANSVPYIVALAERAGIDVRLVSPEDGRALMEAHRTPDGRAATPTVVVLDDRYELRGCWIERPAALQHWYLAEGRRLDGGTMVQQKQAWYDRDAGASTLREIVEVLEAAATGTPRCGESGER